MRIAFGDQILDVECRELRRGGESVALEPQIFDLLVHLIRNRERVVSKDELIANLCGGRIVPELTLTTRINGARKAVGDDGPTQHVIRTIRARGFALSLRCAATGRISRRSRYRSNCPTCRLLRGCRSPI